MKASQCCSSKLKSGGWHIADVSAFLIQRLDLYFVRKPNLIPRTSTEAPVVLRRFRDRNFNLIRLSVGLTAHALEK